MQVAAGNGTILNVLEVQPAGKRKMAAAEFLRGRHWFWVTLLQGLKPCLGLYYTILVLFYFSSRVKHIHG